MHAPVRLAMAVRTAACLAPIPAHVDSGSIHIVYVRSESSGSDRGGNRTVNNEYGTTVDSTSRAKSLLGCNLEDNALHEYGFSITLKALSSVGLHNRKWRNTSKNNCWGHA